MAAPEREKYGDAIEPVAIVGIACRFPGDCSTPEQFWDMLAQKRSGHSEVPEDRFNADVWQHPDFDRKGAVSSTDQGWKASNIENSHRRSNLPAVSS